MVWQSIAKSINIAKAINEVHAENKDMEGREHFSMADFIKSELDIFQPPLTQNQIIKGNWVDIYPSNTHYNTGPLEFDIVANDTDYLDLNDTILYIHASIVSGSGNALGAETGKVETAAFVNMVLYSVFRCIGLYEWGMC